MKNSVFYFLISIGLSAGPVFCQSVEYDASVNLIGLASTGEKLPFWMYHNQRGRISEDTNLSGWISGTARYDFYYDTFLEVGGGLLYQDALSEDSYVDELYVHYETYWFYATAGRKQQKERFNGLSASNESILRSLNTQPLPGLQLGTLQPLFLFSEEGGLGVELSWAEYRLEEERYVSKANLHHKSLYLVYEDPENFKVKAGLQHYSQWGGISPEKGRQPEGIAAYVKTLTAQNGNTLGSYELELSKDFRNYRVHLIYNYLFENFFGAKLNNLPDGRYAVFIETHDEKKLINSLMYEYYNTHSQGHSKSTAQFNNYFNNSLYLSGWTYGNRVMGTPFFTVDPNGEGIVNNKFNAHHLGIGGQISDYFQTFPYKLLLSYAYNDGTYLRRIRPKEHVFYGFLNARVLNSVVDLNVLLGVEYSSHTSPIYGIGSRLIYHL